MNVGIDIDGTICELPELFSVLTKALKAAGHSVFILSYRDPARLDETRGKLAEMDIAYDEVFLHDSGGDPNAWRWKADMASKLRLDIMFDDSAEVLSALPDGVRRMWLCDPQRYDLSQIVAL